MNTYEEYLSHDAGNVLPMEEAMQIYQNLVETVNACTCDDKDEFVNELIMTANKYVSIRVNWETYDNETRMQEDSGRTSKHNRLIDSFNILARLLNSEGIETPWREQLGDQRKRIGDFACFMVYMIGINNR